MQTLSRHIVEDLAMIQHAIETSKRPLTKLPCEVNPRIDRA